jgi:hypothetical protein
MHVHASPAVLRRVGQIHGLPEEALCLLDHVHVVGHRHREHEEGHRAREGPYTAVLIIKDKAHTAELVRDHLLLHLLQQTKAETK